MIHQVAFWHLYDFSKTPFIYRLCVQFTKGDLQCGDLLTYLLTSKKIDTVLHFAAQVGTRTFLMVLPTGICWCLLASSGACCTSH